MLRNYVVSPIIKVILFEKNKSKKIQAILRGIMEGIIKKPEREVRL